MFTKQHVQQTPLNSTSIEPGDFDQFSRCWYNMEFNPKPLYLRKRHRNAEQYIT